MSAVRIPQLIVLVTFLLGLVLYSRWPVHHDVAWLMYCGQRMFEGARLYVDCVEVNPPISFYLTLLPAYVAQRFGLPANLCLTVYVLALAALSIALTYRVLGGESRSQNWWVAVILGLALVFTGLKNFGQREHFAAILAIPYLFCCAARLSGQPVARPVALLAGLMAGIAFSIKHYFLLVPLIAESVLGGRRRSVKSLNRPEIYGAVLAGLCHAAYVVSAHPEYFTTIAPMAMEVYDGYAIDYLYLLISPWCFATILALIFYVRARKLAASSTAADVLAAAAAIFLAIYVIQDRGWQYHVLPAQIFILAASLIVAAKTVLSPDRLWQRLPAMQKPLIWIAPGFIVLQVLVSGPYSNIMPQLTLPYIQKYSSDGTYYVLSSTISTGFPLPIEEDVTWGSRFPFQWLLPGVVKGMRADCRADVERCERLKEIRSYALNGLAEDLETYKPGVVVVDFRDKDDPSFLYDENEFDLLRYFIDGSPRFAKAWQQYEFKDRVTVLAKPARKMRTFEVWVRRTGPEAEPAQTSFGTAAPLNAVTTP